MARIPEAIDKYKLEELIATGGMGRVYRGVHPTLDRPVIIKKLSLRGEAAYAQRFRREASILMDFRSDYIVDVYDHFRKASNHYIVMEYVDGLSAQDLLRRERYLDGPMCAYIALCTAKALAYAHRKKVIHRDIKPANVLISREGDVKLADFGIATGREGESDITSEGMTLGTPSYMAPEQFADSRSVDGRADFYSLGVMLYELLTGRKPYPGKFGPELIRSVESGKYKRARAVNPAVALVAGLVAVGTIAGWSALTGLHLRLFAPERYGQVRFVAEGFPGEVKAADLHAELLPATEPGVGALPVTFLPLVSRLAGDPQSVIVTAAPKVLPAGEYRARVTIADREVVTLFTVEPWSDAGAERIVHVPIVDSEPRPLRITAAVSDAVTGSDLTTRATVEVLRGNSFVPLARAGHVVSGRVLTVRVRVPGYGAQTLVVEPRRETGIDFLLLVDNSGSMYDPVLRGERRIDHARRALSGFLQSVTGSRDRVALGAFNTYLYPLAPLGASPGELMRSLDRLEEPPAETAYTELYQAMDRLLEQFVTSSGRKAVIVLSDGEDYPFARHAGVAHPVWGDGTVTPDEVIERYIADEVSLYAISFADAPDSNLARIADATGGALFEASDATELSGVYASIRNAIRGEVLVRIRVPSAHTVERNVTVTYDGASDEEASDDAEYLAPLLLGAPAPFPWLIALLILLATGGVIAGLHFVSLERPAARAEIQTIGAGRTVVLQESVTVIGSAPDAGVSLAGTRGVDRHHATVVHDAASGSYTLVADHPVRVNNSLAKRRRLKPGDVITVEDVTLVFDAPEGE